MAWWCGLPTAMLAEIGADSKIFRSLTTLVGWCCRRVGIVVGADVAQAISSVFDCCCVGRFGRRRLQRCGSGGSESVAAVSLVDGLGDGGVVLPPLRHASSSGQVVLRV
jgi:hypothetical protein